MTGTLPADRPAVLSVEGLSAGYGGAPAVENVTFAVRAGEVFGLLGANGSGKSTVARAVAGRLEPVAGAVVWRDGARPCSRVGVAPQRPALFDRLTARENLSVFGRFCGLEPADVPARVAETLGLVGADAFADTPARRLSGGQRQRVNIGAAIIARPSLVILDEPAAALDGESVEALNAVVETMTARGSAFLLITHDMTQAERLCARIGVMAHGRLLAVESPAAIRRRLGAKGLRVRLAPAAGRKSAEAPDSLLSAWGFSRGADGAWSGEVADGADVARLLSSLAGQGVALGALDVRPPDLAEIASALATQPAPDRAA